MEIKLTNPIEIGGTKKEKLIIPRPKGKHLRKLPVSALESGNASVEVMVPFICVWLSITEQEFDELDGKDIIEIMGHLEGFLGLSPETGKN
jgi:hypothetical protein